MWKEILFGLFFLILIFIIYRLTCLSEKPNIIYNSNGNVGKFVQSMESLKGIYKPVSWLVGGDIHTIYGMRYRPKSKLLKTCRRELFQFEDRGTSALDWFEPKDANPETPIVVIIHTLGGGTREPCVNNFAEECVKNQWRAVVFNQRGLSGAPITSGRFFNAMQYDDIQAIISHIHMEFNPKKVFMAGYSLGAMQLISFIANEGTIDGAATVSHILDGNVSNQKLETPFNYKVYQQFLMKKLTHAFKKNKYVNCPEAANAKHLCDFDTYFTCKTLNIPNYVEYYKKISIYPAIPNLKVPTLILNAKNDPFTSPSALPIEEVKKSDNAILVVTNDGGHVSFLTGNGHKSFADKVLIDWFNAIANSQ